MLHPVLQCGLNDPRIGLGPVIAVAGDQAHAVAVALRLEFAPAANHWEPIFGNRRSQIAIRDSASDHGTSCGFLGTVAARPGAFHFRKHDWMELRTESRYADQRG